MWIAFLSFFLQPAWQPAASPVKSGDVVNESKPTQPDDDGYESDETVLNDTFTPATAQIPFYAKAYKILTQKAIKGLPDKTKVANVPGTTIAELNQLYFQIHNSNKTFKTLLGYRNNLLVKDPNVLTPKKKK